MVTPTRVLAIALSLALLTGACTHDQAVARREPSYKGAKTVAVSRITFDDGDTFDLDGKPIRVLGIDTPEITDRGVGIYEDQPFGRAASESTRVWMQRAKRIEIVKDGRDRYDRRLAHVFVDEQLLAEKLLAHGLAYENVSHFGDNGFPDLADRIRRAAAAGPKPAFEPPHLWRKKHQHKSTTR